ncbi:MAG: hypothetical protein ACE5JQ_13870 [Candidatus Methylomirabilales bacterium]
MDNQERLTQRLQLAFQVEGLPVGAILVRSHHLGLLEVEIDGRGPFILSPALLENSDPEGGYVSEELRDWIDQVYLKIRCYGAM